MNEISYIDFIISLVAAMIAGVIIGFERLMKKKNAGLKTND